MDARECEYEELLQNWMPFCCLSGSAWSFVERERSKILLLVFLRFVIVEKYEEQLAEVGLSG